MKKLMLIGLLVLILSSIGFCESDNPNSMVWDKSDNNIQQKLIKAIENFDISKIDASLKAGAQIDYSKEDFQNPLMVTLLEFPVSNKGTYEIMEYLLKHGANPNGSYSYFKDKWQPLHMAVFATSIGMKSNDSEWVLYTKLIIEELLSAGAFVSGRTEKGLTPLHIAAQTNNTFAAYILIKAGSKIMPKDNLGKTPLDYAESSEMIRFLKENGATEE
jgi:ankyrin repeat protein